MAASRAIIPMLVGMMLLTGVCNTILTKYQVRSSTSPMLTRDHRASRSLTKTTTE